MDAVTFQKEAEKLEKLLYHISWSMLSNREDCADAIQEALTRAWQRKDTLKNKRAFRPWLTRILHNVCNDMLRHRQQYPKAQLPDNLPAVDPTPYDELLEGLAELSPKHRTVIILHYYDGYRIRQIADMLDIKESTVKSQLMYARIYLANWLNKHGGTAQ